MSDSVIPDAILALDTAMSPLGETWCDACYNIWQAWKEDKFLLHESSLPRLALAKGAAYLSAMIPEHYGMEWALYVLEFFTADDDLQGAAFWCGDHGGRWEPLWARTGVCRLCDGGMCGAQRRYCSDACYYRAEY